MLVVFNQNRLTNSRVQYVMDVNRALFFFSFLFLLPAERRGHDGQSGRGQFYRQLLPRQLQAHG